MEALVQPGMVSDCPSDTRNIDDDRSAPGMGATVEKDYFVHRDGLRSVDDDFIHMMRTLDGSRWDIFRRIEFPAALPSIFSGMRIAATFAAIGAVFGEWSGASAGLGFVMLESTPNLQTARIFAAIFILTLIALLLFGLVSLLERIFVPWAPRRGAM